MMRNTELGRALRRDVRIGLFLIGLAATVSVLSPEHLDSELGQRLVFVAIGAVGAFYANAAAKKLVPLAEIRGDPMAEQSFRRFSAWSLTLGGLGYALAWILVPFAHAVLVSVAALGGSMSLVLARWMWIRTRGTRS